MTNSKKYLLIPSIPTPNGRLHLGHIGGPFLSADILARYLRTRGHSAWVISGTDSFESYAAGKAEEEHRSPEETCNYYHPLIEEDLRLMGIQMDLFINPLKAPWKYLYQHWHHNIYNQLINNGTTLVIKEKFPWDEDNQRYLSGYWLKGDCPICRKKTASYFCENCGTHFRPEELIQEDAFNQKEVENIFLKLPNGINLSSKGVSKEIQAIFHNYLERQNQILRLTTFCDWGLADPNDKTRTLFSYGFVFAYFLMIGEIAGQLIGINRNAFASDSDVITISSFGIDNSIPFLSSSIGVSSACPQYKPFDYYLVNYFYYLDGDKFSTSRQHMIGVEDIITCKELSSDLVRLFLAAIDVRHQTGDFLTDEFIHYYNQTVDWLEELVITGIQNIAPPTVCDDFFKEQLNELLKTQGGALQPENYLPHLAVNAINHWIIQGKQLNQDSKHYFWWLKGLSLAIYPFMPNLGQTIWESLGYENSPRIKDFFALPLHSIQKNVPINRNRISQELMYIKEEHADEIIV
ncbi:TPA: methionine--tRNA ligase [Legionella pneumophila]